MFLLFFSDKVNFPSVGTHLTNHSACHYQITIKRFKRDWFYSLHNVFVKKNDEQRQPLTNLSWWKKVAAENTCWWRWTAACLIPDSTWLHASECPFQFPSTSTENPLLSGTEIWILHHLICSSQEPYLKRRRGPNMSREPNTPPNCLGMSKAANSSARSQTVSSDRLSRRLFETSRDKCNHHAF